MNFIRIALLQIKDLVNETSTTFPNETLLIDFYKQISDINKDISIVHQFFQSSANEKIYEIIYFDSCKNFQYDECVKFADGIFMKVNKKPM